MKTFAKIAAPVALVLASFGVHAGEGPAQIEIQQPVVQSSAPAPTVKATAQQQPILPGA
ncbi:MAG: hypothetical protein ACK54X_11545 [Burkholderiales bacterium]|jgi:hypothetical protein